MPTLEPKDIRPTLDYLEPQGVEVQGKAVLDAVQRAHVGLRANHVQTQSFEARQRRLTASFD